MLPPVYSPLIFEITKHRFDFFIFLTDTEESLLGFLKMFDKVIPHCVPRFLAFGKADLLHQEGENVLQQLQAKGNNLGFREVCAISCRNRDISKLIRSLSVIIEKP